MSDFYFQLNRQAPDQPAISVIGINKDHAHYLEDNILSILSQRFDDYEYIVADSGSTDGSQAMLARYPFIRVPPGSDSSRSEGLARALAAAKGRYIMVTTSTDGYLSRNWFSTAARALDSDTTVSLVYGASASMSLEGSLGLGVWPPPQLDRSPQDTPEKSAYRWLLGGFSESYLPELNYCVRANVFRNLFGPSVDFPELDGIDPILRFHFEFHRLGYISKFIPVLANFGRTHPNQEQFSERNTGYLSVYSSAWQRYRAGLVSGQFAHLLRTGDGTPFLQVKVSP